MAGTTKVTVTLKVYWGPQARFSFHVAASVVSPTDPIVTGLITVLEAITRGKAIEVEISLSAGTAATVTTSVAYVSEDKALMRFKDENGVGHAYKVPGLLATILSTDKETIDAADPLVSAYTSAVVANALTEAGDDVSEYVSGHRVANRKPIKKGRV
jgi:hypothetical protein